VNLVEGLLEEIDRCNELAGMYRAIGAAGVFGLSFLEADIKEAKAAIGSGDAVGMLRAYEKLKAYER
jgi:hypothetical protein